MSEPVVTLLVVLIVAVIGIAAVKLEDWLRELWRWRKGGPGWIERRRRSNPSK